MSDAFRQNDEAFLEAPTEQDLCGRLVVFGCERFEQRIFSTRRANKRRAGLEDDTTLGTPFNDVRTSEPWMELDLVDTQDASVIWRLFLTESASLID